MKYLHLIGDKKQVLETFAKKYDLQLQDKFVEDFTVLRSACQDMVKPLLQSSEDEAALGEAHAWVVELGKLYQELSIAYEQHLDRVEQLKECIQNALW
jgi:hypothetical protein